MTCYRCKRVLPDGSTVCRSCGAPQCPPRKIRRDSLGNIMRYRAKVGKKSVKVGSACLAAFLCVILLVSSIYALPLLGNVFSELFAEETQTVSGKKEKQPIDQVQGSIISIKLNISGIKYYGDTAYDDGSWERIAEVGDDVQLKFVREPHDENWINDHFFGRYPEVHEAEQIDPGDCPLVSGYNTQMVVFSDTVYSEGRYVEILYVNEGEYDHLFIAEYSIEEYDEYSVYVDDWINSLHLVDAQTGEERYNPLAPEPASRSDTQELAEFALGDEQE